jgi:hypothetical protein
LPGFNGFYRCRRFELRKRETQDWCQLFNVIGPRDPRKVAHLPPSAARARAWHLLLKVCDLTHPEVHFHFTPTHASWLNQIEIWFSILSAKALRGASFRSVKQLIEQIDAFISAYNEDAAPFEWTKVNFTAKTLASKYTNLFN